MRYTRAHPRSRGENVAVAGVIAKVEGSSPLTRGKPGFGGNERVRRGLIPAHAGKTRSSRSGTTPERAHPRSRGENSHLTRHPMRTRGSSPLTRGKRFELEELAKRIGLIPAHAGKTTRGSGACSTGTAHPRSRGENSCRGRSLRLAWGSSPLTRGKRRRRGARERVDGLIPAHAGKTRNASSPPHASPAHPRSRGENEHGRWCPRRAEGSSPLTRGKLRARPGRQDVRGLIPAHAGKTAAINCGQSMRKAHPRSRGENMLGTAKVVDWDGSSPLTRGKPMICSPKNWLSGLIPAHAGKTPTWESDHLHAWAHPRSRGENWTIQLKPVAETGSSPLTRGKPSANERSSEIRRLIPAHAGKTRLGTGELPRYGAHPRSRGENTRPPGIPARGTGSSPLTRGKPWGVSQLTG